MTIHAVNMYVGDCSRSRSHLIQYPDGISRILTLSAYEWDWVDLAERNGFAFKKLLAGAIRCAEQFPTDCGFQHDILEATRSLLRIVAGLIYEETTPVVNDNA